MAQSQYEPQWISYGLYDGTSLIGYAMCGTDIITGNIWIDRFMIDCCFQGQGYAKAFLPLLISHLQSSYDCPQIYLSLHPDNEQAHKLYATFNFHANGEMEFGEEVMVLDLPQREGLDGSYFECKAR